MTTKKATATVDEPVESPNLHQRLLAITAAGGIDKSGKTKFGDQYAFHRIDDVEAHVGRLLCEHGVTALPTVVAYEPLDPIKTTKGENQRVRMLVAVLFTNVDDPDDSLVRKSWGEGEDRSDKMSGNAMSYALKNLYIAMFHLKGGSDNETNPHAAENGVTVKPPTGGGEPGGGSAISEKQAKRLWAIAKSNDWTGPAVESVCYDEFGYKPREIPKGRTYEQVVEFFETTSPYEYEESQKILETETAAQADEDVFGDLEGPPPEAGS